MMMIKKRPAGCKKANKKKATKNKANKKKATKQAAKKTIKKLKNNQADASESMPDVALLYEPYSSFLREMWNSRERLRLYMHP